jgi:hypothetical protein
MTQEAVKAATGKPRFSLAGVQLKLSVMKNAGKEGGITLPSAAPTAITSPSFRR